jgi:hypothetical protein
MLDEGGAGGGGGKGVITFKGFLLTCGFASFDISAAGEWGHSAELSGMATMHNTYRMPPVNKTTGPVRVSDQAGSGLGVTPSPGNIALRQAGSGCLVVASTVGCSAALGVKGAMKSATLETCRNRCRLLFICQVGISFQATHKSQALLVLSPQVIGCCA